MIDEKLPQIVIDNFAYYYNLLLNGDKGNLPENMITPAENLQEYSNLDKDYETLGELNRSKIVVIKLNGGLGTSMGLSEAKSLLKVKNNLTFLDIIAKQSEINKIPLVLMNSYNTRKKSIAQISNYFPTDGDIPLDFLQHKIPKINADNYQPVEYEKDSDLEWCPPGHGEIYTALVTSGLLEILLSKGIEFAFISNSDNLGAVTDLKILGYIIKKKLPFLMEVARRTVSDKKGGHLARLKNGRFVLRESAQCPESDLNFFQDIEKHQFFNTNNIWINLKYVKNKLEENNNVLKLPMIVNNKTVNPKNPESQNVIQLETAMGAAISVFDEADAIVVPRTRFAPVKTTEDLLAVRSDYYLLTEDFRLLVNPERELKPISINLDPKYYKLVEDLNSRIPFPPSLVDCEKLEIIGDYYLGKNLKFTGIVELNNDSNYQKKLDNYS